MFHMIAGVLLSGVGAGSGGGGASDITADWDDINIPSGFAGANAPVTITFSGGGTRLLQVTFADTSDGWLRYKKNSNAAVGILSGGTIEVASGDELFFRYGIGSESVSFIVTVSDLTLGGEVDTFNVTGVYSEGGGGLPP